MPVHDPLRAMMGEFGSDEEKMQALAAQMRGGSATGARLATSSLAPIQKQGQAMQAQAMKQAQEIGLQEYRKASLADKKAADKLKAKQQKSERWASKASQSMLDKFESRAEKIGNVDSLIARFDPEFAGTLPVAGNIENWIAGNIGGTEGMKAQAAWWGDFRRFYENIERHELFGSALTATEQRAWKASTITPDMDPKEIQKRLQTLRDMGHKVSAFAVKNATNKGWDSDYVKGVYSNILPQEALDNPDAYESALQKKLSDPNYHKRGVEGGDTPNYGAMSLEELRKLAGE